MVDGKSVAVVVPAHDEEELIGTTLAGIPAFVDRVYVVDDGSRDATAERARAGGDARVEIVAHEQNRGVGAAIVTGYKRALADAVDVVCVMAALTIVMLPPESVGVVAAARCLAWNSVRRVHRAM